MALCPGCDCTDKLVRGLYNYYSGRVGSTVTVRTRDGVTYNVTILNVNGAYPNDFSVVLDVTDPLQKAQQKGIYKPCVNGEISRAILTIYFRKAQYRYSGGICECWDVDSECTDEQIKARTFRSIISGWTERLESNEGGTCVYKGKEVERAGRCNNLNCELTIPSQLKITITQGPGGMFGGGSGGGNGGSNGGGNNGGGSGGEEPILSIIRIIEEILKQLFGTEGKNYNTPHGVLKIFPEIVSIKEIKCNYNPGAIQLDSWKKGYHKVVIKLGNKIYLVKVRALLL